jgi:hypothetical protein
VLLTGNELFEISVVGIPSNPDAVLAEAERALIKSLLGGAHQPKGNEAMSTALFAAHLGLDAKASDLEVADAILALKKAAGENHTEDLLEALGVESFDKALGVVAGLKASADSVVAKDALIAELEAKALDRDRDALIAEGVKAKKVTPAQRDWLKKQSLDTVKGFLETAPVVAALAAEVLEEPGASGSTAHGFEGKAWGDLKPGEKAALYHSNKALYDAMKAAAQAE